MSHVLTTLDRGEFKLSREGTIQISNWQRGFDGFFNGDPREKHDKGKARRQGWEAGRCVQRLADETTTQK